MKKTTFVFLLFSMLVNAILFSLGTECLFNLLGLTMGISLDGSAVVEQYPRFIPFCIILGTVASLGLIAMLILNIKASEKLCFTKSGWLFEYISSFILSVPMIKLGEMLFRFLQKTF